MMNWLYRLLLSVNRTNSSIVQLLQSDPQGWDWGEHWASHKATGVNIWIANKAYALHVELGNPPSGATVKLKPFERKLIWEAVRPTVEANARRRETEIDRVIAKFLAA